MLGQLIDKSHLKRRHSLLWHQYRLLLILQENFAKKFESKGSQEIRFKNGARYLIRAGNSAARGIANLSNRISDNSSKIMEQSRQIELGKERAAKLAELKKKYPAPAYKGTFAPLKPMSFISQPSAPKAAPAARPAAKTTPRPAASASAPAAKPMARPSASVARIDTPMVRSVATQEVAPMAKREVKIDTTTKRGSRVVSHVPQHSSRRRE